jgi:hypothetical protein
MTSIRTPVGPLSPDVYWRRRLVVGISILAVIIIIVLIIVRPGSGTPADAPTAEPQTSGSAAPADAPATSGEVTDCAPSQIVVTANTDAESYPAGQQPQLSLTVLNTGTVACTLPAGSDVQTYVISSGSDRIWASTDCQQPGVAAVITLEPGEPLPSTPFAWERSRSSVDNCEAEREQVIAGGATYRLSVSVGAFESADDRPFILN